MPCDKTTQWEYIKRDYQRVLRKNPIDEKDIWYTIRIDPLTDKVVYEFPNDNSLTNLPGEAPKH